MRRLLASLAFAALALSRGEAQPRASADDARVRDGFSLETIAHVPGARELAVTPNGDLLVGTSGSDVVLVPDAQGHPGAPRRFTSVDDRPAAGIALDGDALYVGAHFGVYEVPYRPGDRSARAQPRKIATLRPSKDAHGHATTTVAASRDTLYASVGSSCNNCQPELDATRATIEQMRPDGSDMRIKAEHIRNAIALAINGESGHLWAGVAGQDELPHGHPYEIFDDVGAHAGRVDYGWPYCYENRKTVDSHDCSKAAIPRVVFPAYETPIGAAFYPPHPEGAFAFPAPYRGGAFVALHGSWHQPPVAPRVVFVPMRGDEPKTKVNWSDPTAQWNEFLGGFQRADGVRGARPTGVAVAPDGSLFVAEDEGGSIYRIRPKK